MTLHVRRFILAVVLLLLTPFASMVAAEQIPVRHTEGLVHGFLVLRSADADNKILADGELLQVAKGLRVTSELLFHFKDGSLYHESAVFSERGRFRFISDHLIQKGPSFKRQLDMSINGKTGEVKLSYTDDDGKQKSDTEKLPLPPDLSNGLLLTLLKNLAPDASDSFSMVAATPKPRLVKLTVTSHGEDSFMTGSTHRKATHYVVKIELGGLAGWLAPLIGKQPPDIHVWILQGKTPAFVKMEGPLYAGGPIWRIELTSPEWPDERPESSKNKH